MRSLPPRRASLCRSSQGSERSLSVTSCHEQCRGARRRQPKDYGELNEYDSEYNRALKDPSSLRRIVGLDTGPGILYTSNFANQWMEAEYEPPQRATPRT